MRRLINVAWTQPAEGMWATEADVFGGMRLAITLERPDRWAWSIDLVDGVAHQGSGCPTPEAAARQARRKLEAADRALAKMLRVKRTFRRPAGARNWSPKPNALAASLRARRGQRHQAEVAVEISISRSALSELERGTHAPSTRNARAVAAWLGWSLDGCSMPSSNRRQRKRHARIVTLHRS
jgi:DNA-binding XRE family transcriptional regulator